MKQPAICSCLSVLTANPWACFKAYCTEEGSEISGGSDIKDCAEQFKPNIMYISNRRTLFPLYYIYTDHLQCLQQSPMFVELLYIECCSMDFSPFLQTRGYMQKIFVHDKNMVTTPQKPHIYRYVKENPYIPLYMVVLGCFWWFSGVMHWYGCGMVVYGWFWWYMVCYGYIYGRSLYIDAQPSSSTSSTYSFRTLFICLPE